METVLHHNKQVVEQFYQNHDIPICEGLFVSCVMSSARDFASLDDDSIWELCTDNLVSILRKYSNE